jgi:UDP-glucose 4-epimerase
VGRVNLMKALVTGASGFIGSQLIVALKKNGYELRLLSRQKILNYDNVLCDLGTEKIPESALDSIDVVFHLAGYTHDVVNSPSKDKLYYDVNVKATSELIKIAANKGVKNFVFLSSVKAGGVASSKISMSEDDKTPPKDVYGFTKRAAEEEILQVAKINNIIVSIIRPALVYGDGMKGNLADMLNSIRRGWFPPLPETNNKRSMVSIIDLVDAIILVTLNQKSSHEVYIVTDGQQYSSRDIYNSLNSMLGKKPPNWAFPKLFFFLLAIVGNIFKFVPFDSHKYEKLFGSEYYSSDKINRLGYIPKYNFASYLERNN